jgi:hypothetical protein
VQVAASISPAPPAPTHATVATPSADHEADAVARRILAFRFDGAAPEARSAVQIAEDAEAERILLSALGPQPARVERGQDQPQPAEHSGRDAGNAVVARACSRKGGHANVPADPEAARILDSVFG